MLGPIYIYRITYFNHLITAASSMPIDNPTKAACHVHLISSALTKPPIAPHRYLSRRLNSVVCSVKPSSINQIAKSVVDIKQKLKSQNIRHKRRK